ncbi:response regulator [Daejeonella sp. JGW-45]|uniref:response regulator n=1 Tax=Daejeonella sp. JGW-45 TaxID=3034148 RepID=UPI0023EB52D2|nr:response regulator [Daejeonella sp. JGW-45]
MKKKILVVERDEDILYIIRHLLEEQGYAVGVSITEEGIVDRVIKEKPDIILLDIIKPTAEGTALCNALKRVPSIKHIPVIVLSTYPQIQTVKIECADDIIDKPFDISEIINVIEDHLAA